jgi:hypothetical protein
VNPHDHPHAVAALADALNHAGRHADGVDFDNDTAIQMAADMLGWLGQVAGLGLAPLAAVGLAAAPPANGRVVHEVVARVSGAPGSAFAQDPEKLLGWSIAQFDGEVVQMHVHPVDD